MPETMTSHPLDTFLDWATDPQLAVLDTETTGLQGEVIELALVDAWGRTLFDERIRPSCPIEPGAQAVHGISDADVQDCPTIAEFWPRLRDLLTSHHVVIYNKAFDLPRLVQSLDAAMPGWHTAPEGGPSTDLKAFWAVSDRARCVMLAYAPVHGQRGSWDSWRWARLRDACVRRGVREDDLPGAHNALGDCLRTLRLIQATAALTPADVPWLEGEE